MYTGGILNRVEIMTYSMLTSLMSGMERLRGLPQSWQSLNPPAPASESHAVIEKGLIPEQSLSKVWSLIKDTVPPLFLWLVLGFAAGFLIGMVQPR
jgi:hypothetical protein